MNYTQAFMQNLSYNRKKRQTEILRRLTAQSYQAAMPPKHLFTQCSMLYGCCKMQHAKMYSLNTAANSEQQQPGDSGHGGSSSKLVQAAGEEESHQAGTKQDMGEGGKKIGSSSIYLRFKFVPAKSLVWVETDLSEQPSLTGEQGNKHFFIWRYLGLYPIPAGRSAQFSGTAALVGQDFDGLIVIFFNKLIQNHIGYILQKQAKHKTKHEFNTKNKTPGYIEEHLLHTVICNISQHRPQLSPVDF